MRLLQGVRLIKGSINVITSPNDDVYRIGRTPNTALPYIRKSSNTPILLHYYKLNNTKLLILILITNIKLNINLTN